jgi:hypothetical protein
MISIAMQRRRSFGELETGAVAKYPKVSLMMIGEQPGDHEDREGRPSLVQRESFGKGSGRGRN